MPGEASCPRIHSPLASLRDAMLRDLAAAEAYEAAADRGGEAAGLLREYARERREAAREKRNVILGCFR